MVDKKIFKILIFFLQSFVDLHQRRLSRLGRHQGQLRGRLQELQQTGKNKFTRFIERNTFYGILQTA